jgi:hypothetical protein
VICKVRAKATWYLCSEIRVSEDGSFTAFKEQEKKLPCLGRPYCKNSIAGKAPNVAVKHFLKRRECLLVYDQIGEFARFDGWKAFVVHFQEGSAGDHEWQMIRPNDCKPQSKSWPECLNDMYKVLIVATKALDASQEIVETNSRGPNQSKGKAADFR